MQLIRLVEKLKKNIIPWLEKMEVGNPDASSIKALSVSQVQKRTKNLTSPGFCSRFEDCITANCRW